MAVNLMRTLLKPLIDATRADGYAEGFAEGFAQGYARGYARGKAKTEAKYENYFERLRLAGVQFPEHIPLDPPATPQRVISTADLSTS